MTIGYTDSQNYEDIADAIREKSGDDSLELAPCDMAQAIADIPAGGGGDEQFVAMVEMTGTSYSSSGPTKIGDRAFLYDTTVRSVSFPSVTKLGAAAFQNCSALESAYMPNLRDASGANNVSSAFQQCTSLVSLDFPNLESMGSNFCAGATALVSVSVPKVTKILGSSFSGCTNLTTVNAPLVTSIAVSAFANCSSLEHVDFPLVTSLGGTTFQKCSALKSIRFDNVTALSVSNIFEKCYALESAIFPNRSITSVSPQVFYDCYNMEFCMLGASNVTSSHIFNGSSAANSSRMVPLTLVLPRVTAISQSPFHYNTTMYRHGVTLVIGTSTSTSIATASTAMVNPEFAAVYVPDHQLATYKAATNWSAIADIIKPHSEIPASICDPQFYEYLPVDPTANE